MYKSCLGIGVDSLMIIVHGATLLGDDCLHRALDRSRSARRPPPQVAGRACPHQRPVRRDGDGRRRLCRVRPASGTACRCSRGSRRLRAGPPHLPARAHRRWRDRPRGHPHPARRGGVDVVSRRALPRQPGERAARHDGGTSVWTVPLWRRTRPQMVRARSRARPGQLVHDGPPVVRPRHALGDERSLVAPRRRDRAARELGPRARSRDEPPHAVLGVGKQRAVLRDAAPQPRGLVRPRLRLAGGARLVEGGSRARPRADPTALRRLRREPRASRRHGRRRWFVARVRVRCIPRRVRGGGRLCAHADRRMTAISLRTSRASIFVAAPDIVPPPRRDEWDAYLSRHGRSFWMAARLIPAPERAQLAGVYAWCRYTDDLVDHATCSTGVLLRALDEWEALSRAAYAGTETGIELLELVMGDMARCAVPFTYASNLIRGMGGEALGGGLGR